VRLHRSFATSRTMSYQDAPLTSFSGLVSMGAVYLVIRFGLDAYMKSRPAVDIRRPAMVSNFLLSVGSLWMFAGFMGALLRNWDAANWDLNLLICDPELKLQEGMDLFNYAFYLSKFWEYIDTVFLILGKKDVIFLHWFHHLITPSIVWGAWIFPGAAAWLGPVSNAGVHVIMYAYYTCSYFGLDRKYGSNITKLQIVQFVTCIAVYVSIFANLLLGQGYSKCGGNLGQYCYVFANYLNFLYLFVSFNRQRRQRLRATKSSSLSLQDPITSKLDDKKTF
jgi:hypothetical protein